MTNLFKTSAMQVLLQTYGEVESKADCLDCFVQKAYRYESELCNAYAYEFHPVQASLSNLSLTSTFDKGMR